MVLTSTHPQQISKKLLIGGTLLLFTLASLNSCVSYRNTSRVGYVAETKVAVINNVADVDVDLKTRVQATSAKTWCVQEAKDQAYYRAIINNNIDILVDPIYEVKSKGKKSIATVAGFAGHYKNVRTQKQENQDVFEINLKNTQATFDQGMSMMDRKLQEIDKLSKVDAVAKEDLKTYLIIANGGANGGATEKTLNTNISIVDKYNSLNAASAATAAAAGPAKPMESGPTVVSKVEPMTKKMKKKK